jgi:hypothetical protein
MSSRPVAFEEDREGGIILKQTRGLLQRYYVESEADLVFEEGLPARLAIMEALLAPYVVRAGPLKEYLLPGPGRRVSRLQVRIELLENFLKYNFPGVTFPAPLPAPLRVPFSFMVGLDQTVPTLEAQLLLLRAALAPYAGQGVFPLQYWTPRGVAVLLRRSARIASQKS